MKNQNLADRIREESFKVLGSYKHGKGTIEDVMLLKGRNDVAVIKYRINEGSVWFGEKATYDQILLTKERRDGTFDTKLVVGFWTCPSFFNVKSARYVPSEKKIRLEITRDRYPHVPIYNTFTADCDVFEDKLGNIKCEDDDPVPPL